jgi:hypothetical protein
LFAAGGRKRAHEDVDIDGLNDDPGLEDNPGSGHNSGDIDSAGLEENDDNTGDADKGRDVDSGLEETQLAAPSPPSPAQKGPPGAVGLRAPSNGANHSLQPSQLPSFTAVQAATDALKATEDIWAQASRNAQALRQQAVAARDHASDLESKASAIPGTVAHKHAQAAALSAAAAALTADAVADEAEEAARCSATRLEEARHALQAAQAALAHESLQAQLEQQQVSECLAKARDEHREAKTEYARARKRARAAKVQVGKQATMFERHCFCVCLAHAGLLLLLIASCLSSSAHVLPSCFSSVHMCLPCCRAMCAQVARLEGQLQQAGEKANTYARAWATVLPSRGSLDGGMAAVATQRQSAGEVGVATDREYQGREKEGAGGGQGGQEGVQKGGQAGRLLEFQGEAVHQQQGQVSTIGTLQHPVAQAEGGQGAEVTNDVVHEVQAVDGARDEQQEAGQGSVRAASGEQPQPGPGEHVVSVDGARQGQEGPPKEKEQQGQRTPPVAYQTELAIGAPPVNSPPYSQQAPVVHHAADAAGAQHVSGNAGIRKVPPPPACVAPASPATPPASRLMSALSGMLLDK